MTNSKYSFIKGLKKSVVALILFAIPFFVTQFPEIANLSIGAVLVLFANWLKVTQIK